MCADELSIVVTHYRTPELLRDCLAKLAAHAPGVPVLVVDTSGTDGLTRLKRDFPQVYFVETANHSQAHAVNVGLKRTTTPFVLQMNADVLLLAGTLKMMRKRFRDPAVGMVGPRCRTPAGTWQNQGVFYRPYYAYLTLTERRAVRVPWLSGCCQLLRREAVEQVGGLNSSFRFYNEDVEWCERLRRAGYRCELVSAAVVHVGGASTPADERFLLEGLRGGAALSRRYRPKLYRSLHRLGVRHYAAWRAEGLYAGGVYAEGVYAKVAHMFGTGQFDESPFGPTLNEDNPAFLDAR